MNRTGFLGGSGEPGTVHSKTWDRKGDAKRWLAKQSTSMAEGMYTDPRLGRTTFGAFWDDYLRSSPHLRPSTREVYTRHGTRYLLPAFGPRRLGDIRPLHVAEWVARLESQGVGAATINASFRLLRIVLNRAVLGELIARNPTRGVKVPKVKREEMRFMTAGEVERIADAAPARYQAMVLLMGFCGLRIGEAAGLRMENLDVLRRRLSIIETAVEVAGKLHFGPPKTEASMRAVPMPSFVAEAIARHLAEFPPGPDGLVFTASGGGPLRRTTFRRRVWVPAVRAADITAPAPRVHDLRHTAAALMIRAGGHPKQIQATLGHSSITVTLDRYGHLFESQGDELAERVAGLREPAPVRLAASVRPDSGATVIPIRAATPEHTV